MKDEVRQLLIAEDKQNKTKQLVEELKKTAAIEDTPDGEEGEDATGHDH